MEGLEAGEQQQQFAEAPSGCSVEGEADPSLVRTAL